MLLSARCSTAEQKTYSNYFPFGNLSSVPMFTPDEPPNYKTTVSKIVFPATIFAPKELGYAPSIHKISLYGKPHRLISTVHQNGFLFCFFLCCLFGLGLFLFLIYRIVRSCRVLDIGILLRFFFFHKIGVTGFDQQVIPTDQFFISVGQTRSRSKLGNTSAKYARNVSLSAFLISNVTFAPFSFSFIAFNTSLKGTSSSSVKIAISPNDMIFHGHKQVAVSPFAEIPRSAYFCLRYQFEQTGFTGNR